MREEGSRGLRLTQQPIVLLFPKEAEVNIQGEDNFNTLAFKADETSIKCLLPLVEQEVFFDAYCTFGTTGLYTQDYPEQLWFPLNEIHQPQLRRVNPNSKPSSKLPLAACVSDYPILQYLISFNARDKI